MALLSMTGQKLPKVFLPDDSHLIAGISAAAHQLFAVGCW